MADLGSEPIGLGPRSELGSLRFPLLLLPRLTGMLTLTPVLPAPLAPSETVVEFNLARLPIGMLNLVVRESSWTLRAVGFWMA